MNERKRFVKCVDCGCQTLPQNARRDGPWAAAASLSVPARVNDGALCLPCATRRREALGLPIEKEPDGGITPRAFSSGGAVSKKITINKQEYICDAPTLDLLILKWKRNQLDDRFRNADANWWLVVVNGRSVPAAGFGSVPIADGDNISIVLGRGRYF